MPRAFRWIAGLATGEIPNPCGASGSEKRDLVACDLSARHRSYRYNAAEQTSTPVVEILGVQRELKIIGVNNGLTGSIASQRDQPGSGYARGPEKLRLLFP